MVVAIYNLNALIAVSGIYPYHSLLSSLSNPKTAHINKPIWNNIVNISIIIFYSLS